jgi:DNA-binding NtrC family response regulator
MVGGLPADALTFLLQAVGPIDALRILLLLRRSPDRAWSSDDIARELSALSSLVEETVAERESRHLLARETPEAEHHQPPDSPAGMSDDKRVELIRVVCSGAMAHAREMSDLLARALDIAGLNGLALDDQMLEHAALGDGFLERAARQGVKLVDIERAYVHTVLRVVGGNKSEAARRLGINRRTLQRRLGGGDELNDDETEDDGDEDDDDVRAVQS